MTQAVQSTSQTIARRLEQLILDGTLVAGKKIPSERQLSERLTVSRSIIREALKELKGRGVIETRHGQGSFVTGMVPSVDETSPLLHLFKDHPRTLYDLLEVREQLESLAASLAAERATNEDLFRIRQAYFAMEQSSHDKMNPVDIARRDHAFHQAISEASHNPVLVHTLHSLMQLMLSSVLASVNNLYNRELHKQKIDQHHRQILDAIMDRDPIAAGEAAKHHLKDVRERLREIERQEQRLIRSATWEADLKREL